MKHAIKMGVLVATAGLALFGFASPASAVSLPIQNPSFELGAPGPHTGPYNFWRFGTNNSGVSGIELLATGAPDGTQVGFTSGLTPGTSSFISKDVAPIIPGATYTLSVMVGQSLDIALTGYRLRLGYNTTPLDPTTNVEILTVVFSGDDIPAPGAFILASITAIAPLNASGDITISLSSGSYARWDQVSLTQTPVPAALPLFASGLGLLAFLARRKKRKVAALAAA